MADKGIIYYKRRAVYDGDYTKNSALLGEEIDGNFFFLRGNDIDTIGIDEENHILTLKRVNGEEISVDITQEIGDTILTFNPQTGVLHVVTPVSEYDVDGFRLNIASDETLKGRGTFDSPLGLSDMEKTGMLAVADEYIDMTTSHDFPVNVPKGYRFVSKEEVNNFGLLYDYAGVEKIAEYLEENSSEWRVPSREDWAKMLDAVEGVVCEESMHDSEESGIYLGEVAGSRLKSQDLWAASSKPGTDDFGFNVLPLGYIDDSGSELEDAVTKRASFWTSSEESLKQEIYIKGFVFDSAKVYQGTWDQRAKASLRLVKDDDGSNFYSNEIIGGENVPCVKMPNGTIWTAKNIGFADSEFSGVTSEKWATLPVDDEIAFFINIFDGKNWLKRRMNDGETVVIRFHAGKEYSAWRVVGEELRGLDGVYELEAETEARIAGDEALSERLDIASSAITAAYEIIDELSNAVSALTARVGVLEEQVSTLSGKLQALNGATADTFEKNVMEVIDKVVLGYPQNISVVKVDSNDHITDDLDDTVAFRVKFAPDVIFLADTVYEDDDDNIEP